MVIRSYPEKLHDTKKGCSLMTAIRSVGTFELGDYVVRRMGYGAMQLAGPHVFGPPKDKGAALAVLREAVAQGVNHIDTSDFYGPHVTNQLIPGGTAYHLPARPCLHCHEGWSRAWTGRCFGMQQ